MLVKSISIVASVFLMVGVGFALRRWGFFRGDAPSLLSRLVTDIGMPCTTAAQLFRSYTRESLMAGLPSLGIAYLSVGLAYALSIPISLLLRIPEKRRGVFRAVFAFGNTIFIGLPVNQALFGDAAIPATLLYYVANTSLFWTLGAMGIQRDGGQITGKGFSLSTLKKVLTPPLVTFFLCAALIFLGVRLPTFLLDTTQYIGNIVTPLSLFFVGTMLADMVRQGLTWERGYGAVIFARFVLSPGLVLLLMGLLGGSMPPLYQDTYLVQASMPTQASCAIVAHTYRADAEYATGAVTITTLLCTLTIPLFAMLSTVL